MVLSLNILTVASTVAAAATVLELNPAKVKIKCLCKNNENVDLNPQLRSSNATLPPTSNTEIGWESLRIRVVREVEEESASIQYR